MHRVDGTINPTRDMVNDELDELFAQAEQDAAAFVEARRAYLLQLQASSDLWNDSELEDRILYGPMDNDNYTAVYIKLHQALSRPDTRGRWTQTQMARWMRRVFFQN